MWTFLAEHWQVILGTGGVGAALRFLRPLLAREKENAELTVEVASLKRQAETREGYIEDLLETIEELQRRKDRAG